MTSEILSDAQPDHFPFRFPGTTGHFMIDNDGHIQSTDPVVLDIDIRGFSVQYVENQYPRSSVIKIMNGNGYVYSLAVIYRHWNIAMM